MIWLHKTNTTQLTERFFKTRITTLFPYHVHYSGCALKKVINNVDSFIALCMKANLLV